MKLGFNWNVDKTRNNRDTLKRGVVRILHSSSALITVSSDNLTVFYFQNGLYLVTCLRTNH